MICRDLIACDDDDPRNFIKICSNLETEESDGNNCAPNDESEQVEDKSYQNDEETNKDNMVIFVESNLTISDIKNLILSFCLRHSLSKSGVSDLIKIIEMCAGKKLPLTNYYIDTFFSVPENVVQYNFYCDFCKAELVTDLHRSGVTNYTKICNQCNNQNTISLEVSNHFILLDLEYQFRSLLDRININSIYNYMAKTCSYKIEDIYNSEIYKLNHQSFDDDKCVKLTFNFSTDGAPIFESSKRSMWPIQLILNELPPKERFKNVILAGIWCANCEPNMTIFMNCFARNCENIAEQGITYFHNNKTINFKISPLFCCVDSVARPMIQNFTQFNGFYGCSYCYHPGTVVDRVVKYPLPTHGTNYTNRSSHEIVDHMKEAWKTNKRVLGVKGASALINLKQFDLVWGYPIDYMHSVLLGVVRQIFDIWTTYGYTENREFYIGAPKNLNVINERLLNIHPPNEIHRTPRPIKERAKWKATEWRSWLLFYCIPCLKGILPDKYLANFVLLQRAIYILLKKSILPQELDEAEHCVALFVSDFQSLYGQNAMTFNVHLLTHLTESVRKTGPLWATSTFCFESNIFNIKKLIKGPTGVTDQIVKKTLKTTRLLQKLLSDKNISISIQNFCCNILSCDNKNIHNDKVKIHPLGRGYLDQNQKFTIYDRVKVNSITYHSLAYLSHTKKNDNSVVKLRDGKFYKIQKFFTFNGSDFNVELKELCCENFYVNGNKVEQCFLIIEEAIESIVVGFNEIVSKCIFVNVGGLDRYVCEFPNTIEIQ